MKFPVMLLAVLVVCLKYEKLKGCELPPNDPSGRSSISLVTPGDYKYVNIKQLFELPNTIKELVFKIQACADGFIAFSNKTYLDRTQGPFYEIIIGGWGNKKSVLTRDGPNYMRDIHKGVVLACNSFRAFWVSWADGYIKVGKGGEVGENAFLQLADDDWNNNQTVEYIGIASHWRNEANWIFNFMHRTDESYEGKNCSTDETKLKERGWCWPINPCHNDAKCLANETTYNCYCDDASNNYGAHCERDFVICPFNPCRNRAKCVNDVSGHSQCKCPRGLKGHFCNIVEQHNPHWKEVFGEFHIWRGVYYYMDQKIWMTLSIDKFIYGPDRMLLATFKDNDTEIEMRGFSSDDIYITFELSSLTRQSSKITHGQDFEISGFLISHHHSAGWEYTGKITKPEKSFGAFKIFTDNGNGVTEEYQDVGEKYTPAFSRLTKDDKVGNKKWTLTVGLGIFFGLLFLAGLVIGVIILSRKGYIGKKPSKSSIINYDRMAEQEYN